jgi:hypothetical protein
MKVSTSASVVSVLCAVSVWLFVVPQLVTTGIIEPGPLLGLMVLLPTPVGLIAPLVGAVAGTIGLVRRADRTWAGALMTLGQALTWILAIVIVVWSQAYGSTGWELLILPASLMLGQVVVASGLISAKVSRRRAIHATVGEKWQGV